MRKEGVTESTSLNWWSVEAEVMTREVFWPAWVEKVWVESVRPLSEVMPPPAPASAPQVMNPWALVSRTEDPEQLRRLSILIPVPVLRPPANVEVAVVEVALMEAT